MAKLKHYFATGLLIILPVFITLYLFFVIFKIVDGIFGTIINSYLKASFGFSIPGIGFILGMILIFATGFAASHLISKKTISVIAGWFLNFPGIRKIYAPIKQIIGFFLAKEKSAFKKVVLVEYPCKGIWSIGFMTNEGFREAKEKTGRDLVHVFIGSTPSPWSGFFVLIPKEEVKFLEMTVEEGINLIVSGGIIKPV